jgi:hypothetical protein
MLFAINKRWSFNMSWVYQTGQAVSLPSIAYSIPNYNFISNEFDTNFADLSFSFGNRNGIRMKPFHKLDLNFQRKTTHKWGAGTIEIGAYNLYNRRNPYYYHLARKYLPDTQTYGQRIKSASLFGIVPSISFTFNIYTAKKQST